MSSLIVILNGIDKVFVSKGNKGKLSVKKKEQWFAFGQKSL